MRGRTFALFLLLAGMAISATLAGQVVDAPPEPPDTLFLPRPAADTAVTAVSPPRQIRALPVPGIRGPQDIELDREGSLRFLERLCTAPALWRRANDPLREALRSLVWLASRPPADSVTQYLADYPFDRIRMPAESFYMFDSVRIIVPLIKPDSTLTDSIAVRAAADEMFISAGKKLEKVKLTSDARPVTANDTLRLNDSVYILMRDFIPYRMPQQTNDTIVLVITDTLAEATVSRNDLPFRYMRNPYVADSLQAAVNSLIAYLEARDSTAIRFVSETGRGSDVWLNSMTDNLMRFWLPNGTGDSVTVWIGSPARNTISLRAEDGIIFRKQLGYDRYADQRVNVITSREEELRRVALRQVKPVLWKFKSDLSYLLSQGIISNWAKGGENNISTVMDITSALTYNNKATRVNSATTARFALGMQASGKGAIKKNLDILEINSKLNHKAFGKFDLSGLFQFKTQFLPGYNYPNDSVKVSKFFNPAIFLFGYGLEYKPGKNTSISFSPISYRATFVPDTANINQVKYGVPADKRSKNELGAYLTVASKVTLFEKVNMSNRVQLFSNFINNPQNVDIDWEMIATVGLNWFTDLRLNIHLIYDDDTLLPVYKKGEPVMGPDGKQKKAPMAQFNELMGVSFVFKF